VKDEALVEYRLSSYALSLSFFNPIFFVIEVFVPPYFPSDLNTTPFKGSKRLI